MKHILQMSDLSAEEISHVLDIALQRVHVPVLQGKGAALLFEHPSARTRNAAEMAVVQLGGHPVTIRGEEVGIDKRETAEDLARTLASFHSLIGARVAHHGVLERMSLALDEQGFDVPLINLLSDREHPTQALADLLTIREEFGSLGGRVVAFIGEGNNVCRSLAVACVLMGMEMRIASPDGYGLSTAELARINLLGTGVAKVRGVQEATENADVLYTDVWVSMGEEGSVEKKQAFRDFTITDTLLEAASSDAIVLHCLPAHRGEEITASVLEGSQSRVWAQVENRMHSLRGLIAWLFVGQSALPTREGMS